MRRLMVFTASLVAISTATAAQEPGDPEAGLKYARANCSECHEVERHSPNVPVDGPPSFTAIANVPGMTGRALAAALQTSHQTMPNFVLSTEDQDDVIAYIMSLRSPKR